MCLRLYHSICCRLSCTCEGGPTGCHTSQKQPDQCPCNHPQCLAPSSPQWESEQCSGVCSDKNRWPCQLCQKGTNLDRDHCCIAKVGHYCIRRCIWMAPWDFNKQWTRSYSLTFCFNSTYIVHVVDWILCLPPATPSIAGFTLADDLWSGLLCCGNDACGCC